MSIKPAGDYPISLRLTGRLCLVVGAGEVAQRKVQGLLSTDARIRLVAPQIPVELLAHGQIEGISRLFSPEDVIGSFLVFAATNERSINAAVAESARREGILVNIADDPLGSDFHLPALLRRGELTVTVSTSGGSPAFSAQLRDHLAAEFGPEWQIFVEMVSTLRQKRLTGGEANAYNSAVISRLFAADLPRLIASQDEEAIDRILKETTGTSITLADIGIHLRKGTT